MSDRVTKKTTKPAPRAPSDVDKQKERKRALDRKAQRASREKTRSHIAHLEHMVKILGGERGTSSTTSELMDEITRLHAEIDRLRKIIDSIKSLLGVEALEAAVAPIQKDSQAFSSSQSPPLKQQTFYEITSPLSDTPAYVPVEEMSWNSLPNAHEVGQGRIVEFDTPEPSTDAHSNIRDTEFTDTVESSSLTLNDYWQTRQPRIDFPHHLQIFDIPHPMKTTLQSTPPPITDYTPCRIWQKAITIYAQIFQFNRQHVYDTDKVSPGSIVKVVKDGWNSLSFQEKNNPVLRILEEVDHQLFWNLDPVTKVANLYKSFLLLKYHFNSKSSNLEIVPPWQRPLHSQKTQQHPVPIDFFPWPALRDRLVRHHNYYFSNTDFCSLYRDNFKFNWPFGFDQIYSIGPQNGEYNLSPLFELYYRDLASWGMEQVFFDKFPEFVGEIPLFDGGKAALELPNQGFGLPGIAKAHFETGGRIGGINVMELFDEYPPT